MNPPLGKFSAERFTGATIDAGRRIPATRRQRPFRIAAAREQIAEGGDGPRSGKQATDTDNRHGIRLAPLETQRLIAGAIGLCPPWSIFWKLVEHHVYVQSADAERVDRGAAGQAVSRSSARPVRWWARRRELDSSRSLDSNVGS